MTRRTKESEMLRNVKVAVCGELPTVCEYLQEQGIIHLDQYVTATDMGRESEYHLILIYAPNGEGLLNTCIQLQADDRTVPIRLLNEPCCRSMLIELRMAVHQIARSLAEGAAASVPTTHTTEEML